MTPAKYKKHFKAKGQLIEGVHVLMMRDNMKDIDGHSVYKPFLKEQVGIAKDNGWKVVSAVPVPREAKKTAPEVADSIPQASNDSTENNQK